jgi:hypothetical protein
MEKREFNLQYANLRKNYEFINKYFKSNGTFPLMPNESSTLNEILAQQNNIVSLKNLL